MFGKFFLILFLLLLISDVYIYMYYIRKMTQKKILRFLWFLPSILLVIGLLNFYLWGIVSDRVDIAILVYIALILPKIFFAIISLFDIPLRYFFNWRIYPFTILALLFAAGIEVILVYGSIFGRDRLTVKEIEFFSDNLPESFDNYKVIQISDLHLGNLKNGQQFIEEMVGTVNRQSADVVVITGDLVNSLASELYDYEGILSEIKAKDGIYSVLGNHDYAIYHKWEDVGKQNENINDLIEGQKRLGWKVLNNENDLIIRDGDTISIIGVENAGSAHFPDLSDLTKAMYGTEGSKFKILLSHDPTHWRREVLSTDIDLMLSGHTHGAQFSIGAFSVSSFVYPEWRGLYMNDKKGLYVNTGIGYVGVPFRFGVWPEITVIRLRRGDDYK